MNESSIGIDRAITPLRLIFWGGLIGIFDLSYSETVNGSGWTFDILNDLVGMLMIANGVFRLSALSSQQSYVSAFRFIKIVAVLSCFECLHDHFIYEVPDVLSWLLMILGLAQMAAVLIFCLKMRWLSSVSGLIRSAESWRVTTILFVLIVVVPLVLFEVIAMVLLICGESFIVDLGAAALCMLPVFAVPFVHLFISTSRMRNEIEQMRASVATEVVCEQSRGPECE